MGEWETCQIVHNIHIGDHTITIDNPIPFKINGQDYKIITVTKVVRSWRMGGEFENVLTISILSALNGNGYLNVTYFQ